MKAMRQASLSPSTQRLSSAMPRWRLLATVLALASVTTWTPRVALADGEAAPPAGVDAPTEAPSSESESPTSRKPIHENAVSQLMAYSVMTGLFLEVGKAEYAGGRNNPGMPTATGFRYYERQGIITGTLTAIAIIVAGAAAASSPKSQRSWESGGYRYTETTYRSEAEKAAIMAGAAAGAAGAASAKNQSFDIELFSRNLGGDVSGWRMNGYYGIPFAERFMFELGMGFGSIDTAMKKDNQDIYVSHGYVGMPFRFNYANDLFILFLEAQWNWLGHYASSRGEGYIEPKSNTLLLRYAPVLPWKIGVVSNLFGRLYGEVDISTPGITTLEFATKATLGLRF